MTEQIVEHLRVIVAEPDEPLVEPGSLCGRRCASPKAMQDRDEGRKATLPRSILPPRKASREEIHTPVPV